MNLLWPRWRIRTQLVLFVLLQVGIILALAGFYLQWQMRRQIEQEMAVRLTALAQYAARITENAVGVDAVKSLLPGDEQSRTAKALQTWLSPLLEAGRLSRLVVFDRERQILFDSQQSHLLGSEYVRLRFDEREIVGAWNGQAVAAQLFFDAAEQPFKAAYAPLLENGRAAAIIGIEAQASGLAAVRETQQVLLSLAGLGLLAAAVSGIIFARQITRPLERLRQAARAIGHGDSRVDLNFKATEEISFLARTMEYMREAIAQREQNLRLMLAGVAHEIRNPLGGIELYAGLLENDVPENLKPQVRKIHAEVRRLENIVRDFLDYARPHSSQPEDFLLLPFLEELHAQARALHDRVKWALRVPAQLALHADREQLRRIFLNLVRNAVEAMNGAGEIQVVAKIAGAHATIAVIDNGPGVPAELAEKIFEPFFTTRAQGSGLGLALVRQLAELNKGKIELLRPEGECGAYFRLSLPLAAGSMRS
ncbi:MAG: ATP-binding protein [bacterium]